MQDSGATALRLFVALPCPLTPPIAAALEDLRAAQQSGSGLRVVDGATLHITLSFPGTVPAERVAAIRSAMAQLQELPPVHLQIRGAGHFASALWLGVQQDAALMHLGERCASALHVIGFAAEQRPFIPHVTLARLKPRPGFDCERWTRAHRATRWADIAVDSVNLYRSDTQPAGARYAVLHSVRLGAGPG